MGGLDEIPVTGWRLETAKTWRSGLAATDSCESEVDPAADRSERTWATIRGLLDKADGLPERARQRAQSVFAQLATAEGRVHGVRPRTSTSMKWVGLTPAGRRGGDVLGARVARHRLGLLESRRPRDRHREHLAWRAAGARTRCGPKLLKDVPVYGSGQSVELTTPTGAALLAGAVRLFRADAAVGANGQRYGAGGRQLDGVPDVLQVVVGEMESGARRARAGARSWLWSRPTSTT